MRETEREVKSEEKGKERMKRKKETVQTETWFQSAPRLRRRMFDGRNREKDSIDRCSAQECVRTHTHNTQNTRLLLGCGYSGLYPAKPPQANTVHSDMEMFY